MTHSAQYFRIGEVNGVQGDAVKQTSIHTKRSEAPRKMALKHIGRIHGDPQNQWGNQDG